MALVEDHIIEASFFISKTSTDLRWTFGSPVASVRTSASSFVSSAALGD